MKIKLYANLQKGNNGISRYTHTLSKGFNIPISNAKKIEFTINNKKYLGMISHEFFNMFNILDFNYDIIHSMSALYPHIYSNVLTIHDIVNIENNYNIYRQLKYISRIKDIKIIVPLNTVKNDLITKLNFSPDNIFVINHGIEVINPETINPYNDYKIHLFLFGGLDGIRRKQQYLLNILKDTNYEVYIAGYGYNSFIDNYKKYSNIHYLGYLSDEEVYNYMAYSDLLIYNSTGEGFGYIPLEAMRFNLTTVINDKPEFHEVYKNNVYYYDNNFLDVIEFALYDKKKNLKEFVYNTYPISRMLSETMQVYKL